MQEEIYGHEVLHEENAESGADYLEGLSRDQAEVFFSYAKKHKNGAEFRDRHNRSFTLTYEGDDIYRISRD